MLGGVANLLGVIDMARFGALELLLFADDGAHPSFDLDGVPSLESRYGPHSPKRSKETHSGRSTVCPSALAARPALSCPVLIPKFACGKLGASR